MCTLILGFFALRVGGSESRRVSVGAPGYLSHVEMLQPGVSAVEIELWPMATETRVREGLTAVLQGIVVDQYGAPAAGKQVQFVPDRPVPIVAFGGRRILQGGVASLPTHATTMIDGSFELETARSGSGMVVVVALSPGGWVG